MKFKTKDGYIYNILDDCIEDQQDQIKMTREEAINKFHEITYPETYKEFGNGESQWSTKFILDRKWANKAIAGFEALGLIKFEEKPIVSPLQDCYVTIKTEDGKECRGYVVNGKDFERGLKSRGYQIIKEF